MKVGGILIAQKNKLSKKTLSRFLTLKYNKVKEIGITDEDLKYITEPKPNHFRVSVPAIGKRKTKVVHDILEAIKIKYEYIAEIDEEKIQLLEQQKTLKDKKNEITKYNTVRQGIELFLKERYFDLQRGFIQIGTYDQDLADFDNNRLEEIKILDETIFSIDKNKAQEIVDSLWDLKKKDKRDGAETLSENTIYKIFSFINKFFNYLKSIDVISKNPFDNVKHKPHATTKKKEYLNTEEIHYTKEKLVYENIRLKALLTFIMDSGLRKEESLPIKFRDFNNFRRTLKVNRTLIKVRNNNTLKICENDIKKANIKIIEATKGYIVKELPKTEDSEREIVLPQACIDLIEQLRTFKEACGFVVTDDDYVFTAWDSMELIDPDRYSKEFTKFKEKIGIKKDIPLKNLRTSHASYHASKGANIKALQNRMGHSNVNMTLDVYAQADLSEDRKLVNEYEDEFYNKLGLSMMNLYQIVSNRFTNTKKLTSILEELGGERINDENFDIQLERCQEYFKELFPIIDKILKIDSLLDEEELESIFTGFSELYRNIKIEKLEPYIKI